MNEIMIDGVEYILTKKHGYKEEYEKIISKLRSTLGSMSARDADEMVKKCAEEMERMKDKIF